MATMNIGMIMVLLVSKALGEKFHRLKGANANFVLTSLPEKSDSPQCLTLSTPMMPSHMVIHNCTSLVTTYFGAMLLKNRNGVSIDNGIAPSNATTYCRVLVSFHIDRVHDLRVEESPFDNLILPK